MAKRIMANQVEPTEAQPELPVIEVSPEVIAERKRRQKSARERDEDGRVLRKGKNLSGNTPWRRKLYQVTSVAPETAVKAMPMQAQLILRHMAETGMIGTGGEIVEAAITAGALKTKIEPNVLFAYYRRLLETVGVEHIG